MKRKTLLSAILMSAAALLLAACACVGPPPGWAEAVVEEPIAVAPEPAAAAEPVNALVGIRVIYFAFDSSRVQPQFDEVIAAHAANLARNPASQLALSGHADERGSREYNLALGERRSLAVKRKMVALGAAPSQIRVVSYGEEWPAEDGHHERAWAKNRRVELRYQ